MLDDKGFRIEKRGKVNIRGLGKMKTYFIEANEHATEDDILGQGPKVRKSEGVEVTFIDDGQEKHPPTTSGSGTSRGSRSPLLNRNKVGPTRGSNSSKCMGTF